MVKNKLLAALFSLLVVISPIVIGAIAIGFGIIIEKLFGINPFLVVMALYLVGCVVLAYQVSKRSSP